MGFEDDGYTYTCDACDKAVKTKDKGLPLHWTLGEFQTRSGFSWEPTIYLCDTCWSSPKVQSPGPTFKKCWYKFGWGKAQTSGGGE